MERRFEQAIAAFRAAVRRRRAERRDRQRAGAGVRADRLSDPRRPGPPVGPELPGQPLDVPGRRRPTSIRSGSIPGSSSATSDDGALPDPGRADARSGSTSRTAAWSDIFFLGMDYPEGARVLNISVDLGVHGRDDQPRPPIETRVRVIPEPILRLTSIDLNACKDVDDARRAVQLRQRLPRPGQGRRDRLGAGPAVARRDRRAGSTSCWRGSSGRGTGWRWSARSTTSPRGRGWRSRRTCWPR